MIPSPLLLIVLIITIAVLLAVVQLGILTIAFDRLGLSSASAILLLITSVIGSSINLPLFKIKAEAPAHPPTLPAMWRLLRQQMPPFTGSTIIAINVGGGLIPLWFSLYLILHNPLPLFEVLIAIGFVATICHLASRPIQGLGIGMPILVAPFTAALTALMIAPEQSAPMAYICGTLGVLIGADIFRLKDIKKMGVAVAAIGGAGTFDGIFITGIVAVLLA